MPDNDAVKINATIEITGFVTSDDSAIRALRESPEFTGEVLKIRAENELFGVRYADPEGVEHVVQGPNKEWAESTYERLNGTNSGPEIVSSRVIYLEWQAI